MRCQHASGMVAWHAAGVTEGESTAGRGKREKRSVKKVGVDMPGACQLSGNAVPAVGMREGATPSRILYLAVTKQKLFCRITKKEGLS